MSPGLPYLKAIQYSWFIWKVCTLAMRGTTTFAQEGLARLKICHITYYYVGIIDVFPQKLSPILALKPFASLTQELVWLLSSSIVSVIQPVVLFAHSAKIRDCEINALYDVNKINLLRTPLILFLHVVYELF